MQTELGQARHRSLTGQNKHDNISNPILLVYKSPQPRKAPTSAQILPYEEEAKEREDRAGEEDVHVLRTARAILLISTMQRVRSSRGQDAPPPLDPSNDISAQTECIRGIEKPPLSTLEHVSLIDQVVQDGPALCDKLVESRVCVLNETVFP